MPRHVVSKLNEFERVDRRFVMNVLLTSSGLESQAIKNKFLDMLTKHVSEVKVMFIPTAAIDADAIQMLPKCMNDLLYFGIKKENITVYDLHHPIDVELSDLFDVVYICGGSTQYLLNRLNENKFSWKLLKFIRSGGVVIGVSAGAVVFAENLEDNLGLLPCILEVHADEGAPNGEYKSFECSAISLINGQAIIPGDDSFTVIGG